MGTFERYLTLWVALCIAAGIALGAVVLIAFVWWPAALTLLACLVVAGVIATGWGWAAGSRAERRIAPLRARLADAVLEKMRFVHEVCSSAAQPLLT